MSLRQLKLFDALYKSDFFIRSLPYGSQFSPTYNLGLLLDLIQVPVFNEVALLVWWSHIHPPLEVLKLSTANEPAPFRNSASKASGLQVQANTPCIKCN